MKFSEERAVYIQRDFFSDARFVRRLFRSYAYRAMPTPEHRDALLEALRRKELDRLVISNPYRDQLVQGLYESLRTEALPFLIVERGALPGSIFLDTTGFLRDSRNYDRIHWDKPLTEAEQRRLNAYRHELAASDEALERQTQRQGQEPARARLLNGRKFLCAVTLQMSTDAVTNHFYRPGLDYDRFKSLIGEAVQTLGDDWEIAIKPHPREPMSAIGGKPTASDVNIADLIAAADAVVTFNSGTGIAAMLQGKPVGCFGDAFYGGAGLTASLNNVADLAGFLRSPEDSHDVETRDRFLHHLIFRLYSEVQFLGPSPFGAMTRPVAMQGKVVRMYDPDTQKSVEIDRLLNGDAGSIDRELERARAWYRAAANRSGATIIP